MADAQSLLAQDIAGIRGQLTADQPHQSGFSFAIPAQETDPFSGFDMQR
jgi:hypothetical protein